MLRELVTRPVSAAVALVELPLTARRTLEEAADLLAASRHQIELMDRQTGDAIEQAERMNELLTRVVKLTEPLEMAQRGGVYFGGALKRAIFGDEQLDAALRDAAGPTIEAEAVSEPAPAAEPAPPAEPENVPGSEAPAPAAEAEPTPQPVPEPGPQPVPEPLPDPQPEPLPDPRPDPGPDPAAHRPEDGQSHDGWRPRGIRAVPDPPADTE
ncbi:MAG: hypothetical protein ACXWGV_06415 [Solirubrobacterales bacterium]